MDDALPVLPEPDGGDDYNHWFSADQMRAYARAAVAADRAARWQPIETAPKDGTHVVLLGDGRVTEGWWEPERWPTAAEHHSSTGEYLGQFETGECIEACWWSCDGGFLNEHPPTMWQPLPEPPTPKEGQTL